MAPEEQRMMWCPAWWRATHVSTMRVRVESRGECVLSLTIEDVPGTVSARGCDLVLGVLW